MDLATILGPRTDLQESRSRPKYTGVDVLLLDRNDRHRLVQRRLLAICLWDAQVVVSDRVSPREQVAARS